jgi:hypothetical protein
MKERKQPSFDRKQKGRKHKKKFDFPTLSISTGGIILLAIVCYYYNNSSGSGSREAAKEEWRNEKK